MLVKNIMSEPVICCTPWDSVRYAPALMAFQSVGALPVASDLNDPFLEGIVTDRDLCSRVLAVEDRPKDTRVVDVITPVPVTCEPHDDLNKCLERMRRHQFRRIPVVNGRGPCVGIVALVFPSVPLLIRSRNPPNATITVANFMSWIKVRCLSVAAVKRSPRRCCGDFRESK